MSTARPTGRGHGRDFGEGEAPRLRNVKNHEKQTAELEMDTSDEIFRWAGFFARILFTFEKVNKTQLSGWQCNTIDLCKRVKSFCFSQNKDLIFNARNISSNKNCQILLQEEKSMCEILK